ncbi:fasciclin domain-containing protein [Methylocella sp.]|uniref:fasciclin domain-containing protein n=1 Tax=Methylocella sp. TaxID=1978226 RepID=UPI0037849660
MRPLAVLALAVLALAAPAPAARAQETPKQEAPKQETPAPAPVPEKFELSLEAGGGVMTASRTIPENLAGAKDLTRIAALLGSAGLAETLAAPGPYTLFAPTDRAFDGAPKEVARLLGEAAFDPQTPQAARRIAAYHVASGRLTAQKLYEAVKAGGGEARLRTLDGKELSVRWTGVRLELVDARGARARVITSDAIQKNGVIHVIDAALSPKS